MKWAIWWKPRPDGPYIPWVDRLFHSKQAAWDYYDRDRHGANAGRPDARRRVIAAARRKGFRLAPAEIVCPIPKPYGLEPRTIEVDERRQA